MQTTLLAAVMVGSWFIKQLNTDITTERDTIRRVENNNVISNNNNCLRKFNDFWGIFPTGKKIARPTENSSGTNPDLNVKWVRGCTIKTIKESQCQKTWKRLSKSQSSNNPFNKTAACSFAPSFKLSFVRSLEHKLDRQSLKYFVLFWVHWRYVISIKWSLTGKW